MSRPKAISGKSGGLFESSGSNTRSTLVILKQPTPLANPSNSPLVWHPWAHSALRSKQGPHQLKPRATLWHELHGVARLRMRRGYRHRRLQIRVLLLRAGMGWFGGGGGGGLSKEVALDVGQLLLLCSAHLKVIHDLSGGQSEGS